MTISGATRRRLTADWLSALSQLTVLRPMHFVRRHGPLLMSLVLDGTRTPDYFVPVVGFQLLCVTAERLYLGYRMGIGPPHAPNAQVSVRDTNVLSRTLARFPFLGRPTLAASEFLAHWSRYTSGPCIGESYVLLDRVAFAAWSGDQALVLAARAEALAILSSWPDTAFRIQSRDAVASQIAEIAKAKENDLHEVVVQQLSFHSLTKIPDLGLIGAT